MFCIHCDARIAFLPQNGMRFDECALCRAYLALRAMNLIHVNAIEWGDTFEDMQEASWVHADMPEPFEPSNGIALPGEFGPDLDADIPLYR